MRVQLTASPELQEAIDLIVCRVGNAEKSAKVVAWEIRLLAVTVTVCTLSVVVALHALKGGSNGE